RTTHRVRYRQTIHGPHNVSRAALFGRATIGTGKTEDGWHPGRCGSYNLADYGYPTAKGYDGKVIDIAVISKGSFKKRFLALGRKDVASYARCISFEHDKMRMISDN